MFIALGLPLHSVIIKKYLAPSLLASIASSSRDLCPLLIFTEEGRIETKSFTNERILWVVLREVVTTIKKPIP